MSDDAHSAFRTPQSAFTRRHALRTLGCGFGYLALADLAARAAAVNPLAPRKPHHAPRAKRIIFLFMSGGVSHVDSFDYKPRLDRLSKDYAPKGVRILTVSSNDKGFVALFGPDHTTQTFVLDSKAVLRSRGAVDDQYGIGFK